MGFRAVTLCGLVAASSACAPPRDAISLTPSVGQQGIVRDGVPALISAKKHTMFLRPAASQQGSHDRPRFVVALVNRGKVPVTLNVSDITVESAQPRTAKMRVYTHAELAREVEDDRNAQLVLSALSGIAGVYSSRTYSPPLAQATAIASTQRTVSDMTEIEGLAQVKLTELQATIIKDHTVMPGEWHGGVIVVAQPERPEGGAAVYRIRIVFDGEEHSFTVSQQRGV